VSSVLIGGKTVSDQDGQRIFSAQDIVDILKELQEEVDRESKTCITRILAPFPVLLWDICNAFGLSKEESDEVLGRSASFVEAWFKGKSTANQP
jgi:type IV secretory pathway VirB4 component